MTWPLAVALKQLESNGSAREKALDAFLEYVFSKNIELYPAQEEAILELFAGKNLILNTPTGSGKSLVATALHFHAIANGRRSIYTCPIKALVNEKFLSLCQEFGPENVGMITGDATINEEAPIICCTAEILSNYALRLGEDAPFDDIIMDEFHYYSDRQRGMAWQIPLLILKKSRFLLMSATLGETEFFEKELTQLNGLETVTIRTTLRPVPLEFEYSEKPLHLKIGELIDLKKSPIYLVHFTQRECAEEAQNLLSTDFCTKEEKKLISDVLNEVDFKSPYGKDIQRLLKHGIGLHHAGLLPKYRVLVEKLAQKGLLKVICGTDTLGVGVNVPIRTVLFAKLCKYDGEKATILSVRDFQQISGRAGRKGFDNLGTVVVQAPEHVIENIIQERKALSDPKKAKKLVKKKPPEKGFLPWNADTLTKLRDGQAEALTSRFQVNHAMILNILGRENAKSCRELRDLIAHSHETPAQKKNHRKLASQLFRSLYDRKIIELNPLRVNVDLQQDFSLNQSLSLFLIDAHLLLDLESESYALDLLTLAESILESPDLILRRQVDRLKTLKMAEMKADGIEFDQRIEELEKIEHPKPNREFIYNTFNAFSNLHPWVGEENIRPKSIAREMFETFQTFHDYIRDYDLHRVEGLLLRYLSDVYKVLVQTIPESSRTDDVVLMIEYFRTLLKETDSTLLDEWEGLRHPERVTERKAAAEEKEALQKKLALEKEAAASQERKQTIQVRNEIYRVLRYLNQMEFEKAAAILNSDPKILEDTLKEFATDHTGICTDPSARSPHHTKISKVGSEHWDVEQTIVDPDGHNDWVLKLTVQFKKGSAPEMPVLGYVSFAAIE